MNYGPPQQSNNFTKIPSQQPDKLTKILRTPFAWSGRHPVLATLITLALLSASFMAGYLLPESRTTIGGIAMPTPMIDDDKRAAHTPVITAGTPTAVAITPAPTHSPQWTTIQTFTGTGAKKTSVFTVPEHWRIAWSCDPTSHNNLSYNLIIHANSTTNALLGNGVETTCKKDNTRNSTEIYRGGKVYLSIISEGKWTVQIQQ
ncbi:MAG: hypothetical protein IMW89_14250 [Ktedonobacteraceae bacterium]|nr:hypothetical protein [Ktedonobacteraceae bacterium]